MSQQVAEMVERYLPSANALLKLVCSADLQLLEPMTGMLDTNAPENGDSPAMEGAGDAFLPDLQAADWTMSNNTAPQMDQYQLENTHLFPVDGLAQEGADSASEFEASEQGEQKSDPEEDGTSKTEAMPGEPDMAVPGELDMAMPGEPDMAVPAEQDMAVPGEQDPEKPAEQDLEKPAEPVSTSDSGSPSNMELEDAGKEEVEDTTMVLAEAVPEEPTLPSEYDRLNTAVEENPEDFNGWVYLLQYVEQEVSGS